MTLTSKESKSFTLEWTGGFAQMDVPKTSDYHIIDKSPATNRPYVYDVSDEYEDLEEAWAIAFETDEYPETIITHMPAKAGVKMSTSDSPDYREGKERAVLGMVLLHIIRSGEDVMVDL